MTWNEDRAFVSAVTKLLEIEGGYSFDPDDPGGETNWGISHKSYPDLDIAALTREDACAIYYRDYWQPHKWEFLPATIAERAFLLGVHAGPSWAVRVLQRAVRSASGVRLKEDGVLGPRTIFYSHRASPSALQSAWRSEQAAYYRTLMASSPTLQKYSRGWLNRAYEDSVTD